FIDRAANRRPYRGRPFGRNGYIVPRTRDTASRCRTRGGIATGCRTRGGTASRCRTRGGIAAGTPPPRYRTHGGIAAGTPPPRYRTHGGAGARKRVIRRQLGTSADRRGNTVIRRADDGHVFPTWGRGAVRDCRGRGQFRPCGHLPRRDILRRGGYYCELWRSRRCYV